MQHRRSPVSSPFLVQQEHVVHAEDDEEQAEALSISDQRTIYLVNIFVSNTAQFLNSFSSLCEDKLSLLHRKISRLDASLTLLESRLNSIDEPSRNIHQIQSINKNKKDKDKDVVCDEPPELASQYSGVTSDSD